MDSVTVTDLKATLSARLRQVRAGEELLVLDRGKPIARLVPVREADAELAELERAGLVHVGTGKIDASFWETRGPADPNGMLAAALKADRDEGW